MPMPRELITKFDEIKEHNKLIKACICCSTGYTCGGPNGSFEFSENCCHEYNSEGHGCCGCTACPYGTCMHGYTKMCCLVNGRDSSNLCRFGLFNMFCVGDKPQSSGEVNKFLDDVLWLSWCGCSGCGLGGITPCSAGSHILCSTKSQHTAIPCQCAWKRQSKHDCFCCGLTTKTDTVNCNEGVTCCCITCVKPADAREPSVGDVYQILPADYKGASVVPTQEAM